MNERYLVEFERVLSKSRSDNELTITERYVFDTKEEAEEWIQAMKTLGWDSSLLKLTMKEAA